MNISTKLLKAAAGQAGGASLDVDDCFSCFLYDGNDTDTDIVNGIDLTEGGLVWIKARGTSGSSHRLIDSAWSLSANDYLDTSSQSAPFDGPVINTFNTNGFNLDSNWYGNSSDSSYGGEYVSWTFRKAPKFFDVVTYTASSFNQVISHNLGTTPGMIMVKSIGDSYKWMVYHRSNGTGKYMVLNSTDAVATDSGDTSFTAVSDTSFTVGTDPALVNNGLTYVAYLFAHNDGDGTFGPDGDQDIIKCGSVTADGSGNATVNLGFEPQWLMIKTSSSNTSGWHIIDNMRGVATGVNYQTLFANSSSAELTAGANYFEFTSTGFNINAYPSATNTDWVYMAIRRGPLAAPTDATKVFAIDYANGSDVPAFQSGFPIDMGLFKQVTGTGTFRLSSRLTQGDYLETSETTAEQANSNYVYDYQNGFFAFAYSSAYLGWMWKRAPNFFDVITHNTGSSDTQIKHNLGVTPELAIYRNRSGDDWNVISVANGVVKLNSNAAAFGSGNGTYLDKSYGANASATHINGGALTGNNVDLLILLFASLSGISKIGQYTGNGSSQTIDCGFSSGARFVLIKRTDASGDWWIFDTVRGIVTGNDSYLALNSNIAENAYGAGDNIDPNSTGFTINQEYLTNANVSGGSYLFYAIA